MLLNMGCIVVTIYCSTQCFLWKEEVFSQKLDG